MGMNKQFYQGNSNLKNFSANFLYTYSECSTNRNPRGREDITDRRFLTGIAKEAFLITPFKMYIMKHNPSPEQLSQYLHSEGWNLYSDRSKN